jgi:hypothetical protein
MQLLNFTLDTLDGDVGTKIKALDITWDLHELCFRSLSHWVSDAATVELEWDYCGYGNLTAAPPCSRFALRFLGVSQLEIGLRDKEMPLNEDECLDLYQCVDNPASLAQNSYGRYPGSKLGADFLLLFTFRGGQNILIAAETAEFVPIT